MDECHRRLAVSSMLSVVVLVAMLDILMILVMFTLLRSRHSGLLKPVSKCFRRGE